MAPVVNRLKNQYGECLEFKRTNYHKEGEWHRVVGPMAAPEFALLSSEMLVLYRWSGVTTMDEFAGVLDSYCLE